MQRMRMSFALATMAVLLAAGAAQAQPQIVKIQSTPLTINVAADGSMQIFNNAVPGTGQIYPSGSQYGDFGVFARIDGALFAPNFNAHTGSATGSLGEYTPWRTISISNVGGNGSAGDPYNVGIRLAAPGTDVTVNVNISQVRGNNFFRMRTQFFSPTTHRVDAFIAGDIYLAGSDQGYFVSVPELNAVGGRNCDPDEGSYNILIIPITPASRFSASFYSDVWAQIGAGALDNTSDGSDCVDNGAGVQWTDIMRGANAVELNAAVSFGAIPSAANFHGIFVDVEPDVVSLYPGESVRVKVTTRHNEELGFNAPVSLSAPDLPQGMTITFDQNAFGAPGDGTTNATLTLDGTVFPQLYRSVGIAASGGNETRFGFFAVDVLCNPPMILGTSQPQSQTVARGTSATLTVRTEGGGAASYQWYAGHAPLTGSPIPGATSATYTTPRVNEVQQYWVRVSNPCGSTDSNTATIFPQ